MCCKVMSEEEVQERIERNRRKIDKIIKKILSKYPNISTSYEYMFTTVVGDFRLHFNLEKRHTSYTITSEKIDDIEDIQNNNMRENTYIHLGEEIIEKIENDFGHGWMEYKLILYLEL